MSLFRLNHQYLLPFSLTSMSPALPALPASSSSPSPSLSLLWMCQGEHKITSKLLEYLAVMLRNGLLTISDQNDNKYYIKKHWLVIQYTFIIWLVIFSLLSTFLVFLRCPKNWQMSFPHFLLFMMTINESK